MRQSLYAFCEQFNKQLILDEWDTARNLPRTPETVSPGSHAELWWRCSQGHVWKAAAYSRTGGSGCPVCAGKQVLSGVNDLASQHPALLLEWDYAKNAPVSPETVACGSHRQVWWLCEKGHSWRSAVRTRVAGSECPVCAGKRVSSGENDLAKCFPALARQWDTEKNGVLRPSDVMPGTQKRVWWKCEKGHEWFASVASRTAGKNGCPICAGKQVLEGYNDLATLEPELSRQWDQEKNGRLRPQDVSVSSNRKVFWRCDRGHSFAAVIASRTSDKTGCPYCTNKKVLAGFNDLATLEPEVAEQWHPTLNGSLTPQMVTPGSSKRVWWQCAYGHSWKAIIFSRAGKQRCGCPVCAGKTKNRD